MKPCCGNCGWSVVIEKKKDAPPTKSTLVQCLWIYHNNVPACLSADFPFIWAHEGKECPCFKAKS